MRRVNRGIKMREGYMVIDLSWGSCGKGLIAGYLAETRKPDTLVSAWGPNAGHVFIDENGRKFLHTMIPNGVVSPNLQQILIGPGSVIDPEAFERELGSVKDLVTNGGVSVYIHPHAAVALPKHREEEAGPMTKIGSTKKGVGAAIIQRIRRDPDDMNIAATALKGTPLEQYVCPVAAYNDALDRADLVQIEGAQGFGLSIYHGFYPYCTSRDITPNQVLADCGMPYGAPVSVIGTMRTYPIRVANRYDTEGNMVGWSGPCYPDQEELDWQKDLGQVPEITTVTKLQRRVFSFSWQQAEEAIRMCRPDHIFLNFVNYEKAFSNAMATIGGINDIMARYSARDFYGVKYIGIGPTFNDVIDIDHTGIDPLVDYFMERDGD